MNRRSFFGFTAGAVAAPAVAAPVAEKLTSLGIAVDTGSALSSLNGLHGYAASIGKVAQFSPPCDRYVYRTGHPAIDALRSISGVHKERMERRLDAIT